MEKEEAEKETENFRIKNESKDKDLYNLIKKTNQF